MDSGERRSEDRHEDRGRAARAIGVTTWLQLIALALVLAGMLWRGGQMTEKLDNVVGAVTRIESDVAAVKTEIPVLKAQINQHEKELTMQDRRLMRVETVPTRGVRE